MLQYLGVRVLGGNALFMNTKISFKGQPINTKIPDEVNNQSEKT